MIRPLLMFELTAVAASWMKELPTYMPRSNVRAFPKSPRRRRCGPLNRKHK